MHEDPLIVHLTIDGELIETTPEHPFRLANGDWVPTAVLEIGSQIQRANGTIGIVAAIEFSYDSQLMYNLTVAAAHTYFVGDGQWLVHNDCGSPIWSPGRSGDPVQNAFDHWKNHGSEFPEFANAKQYIEGTWDFINNPPAGTLTKRRSNEDIIFYHPSSNTFAVQSATGAPRTMFKPDPAKHGYPTNLDYFNAQ